MLHSKCICKFFSASIIEKTEVVIIFCKSMSDVQSDATDHILCFQRQLEQNHEIILQPKMYGLGGC